MMQQPSIMPRIPGRPSAHTLPILADFDISHFLPPVRHFFAFNRKEAVRFCKSPARAFIREWFRTHYFRVSFDACDDGRLAQLAEMFGLEYEALAEAHRDAGNLHNTLDYSDYRLRLERTFEKNRKMTLDVTDSNGSGRRDAHPMASMHFIVVHHSWTHPQTHSCAAIKNQTTQGVAQARKHADRLNLEYRGSIVAIPTMLDTDTGSVKVFGPGGELDVRSYVEKLPSGSDLRSVIMRHIKQIFPSTWDVLLALPPIQREAFHEELVEHIKGNWAYHMDAKETKRRPESIDHEEELIVLGRPTLLFRSRHFFCVEDRQPAVLLPNLSIGLIFAGLHSALAAMRDGNRDFSIPIVVCIPHDSNATELEQAKIFAESIPTMEYNGASLQKQLELAIQPQPRGGERNIIDPIIQKMRARIGESPPEWIINQLHRLPEIIDWTKTTLDRSTRQAVPIVRVEEVA
jgi:hypothetical protein